MPYSKVCSCTQLGTEKVACIKIKCAQWFPNQTLGLSSSLCCPRSNHHLLSIFFRFPTSYITKNASVSRTTILGCHVIRGAIFQNEGKQRLSALALSRISPLSKVISGTKTNEFSIQHLTSWIHERISLSQKTSHRKFARGDGLDLALTLDTAVSTLVV